MTTQRAEGRGKRRSAVLLSLAVGVSLSAAVALAGTAPRAEAAFTEKIVFISNRTTGTGVSNPTGDLEIFRMNPDGTGLKQLTFNQATDAMPTLSPDGTKIAYLSLGVQTSNPEGDQEVYAMNALDGTAKKNLSNNGGGVLDSLPSFSPDGTKIVYETSGVQASNPEGDGEVYRMNALDGTSKRNLSNNGGGISDGNPIFSPGGQKIAYTSQGQQTSNPEGDQEIYAMNVLDGTGQRNLSNNGSNIHDYLPLFSPDGQKIAYVSSGTQTSNPEGDGEVYVMNALDGAAKKNLSNNGSNIYESAPVFSASGQKIAYESHGPQTSNPEGDYEVYAMNALDGTGKKNLTNNGASASDLEPDFSPDGQKIAYKSNGAQTSNPEGDEDLYRMNALDGTGKRNLSNNGAGIHDFSIDWGMQAV
jgi:Tol biopolymer transport system component